MLDHEDIQKRLTDLCIDQLSYSREAPIKFGINKLRNSIPFFTIGVDRNSLNIFIENEYITLEKYVEHKIKGNKIVMMCFIYKSKVINNVNTDSIVDEVTNGHKFIENILASNKKIDDCKHQILNALEKNDINPIEKNLFGIIDIRCAESGVSIYYTYIDGKYYTRLIDV